MNASFDFDPPWPPTTPQVRERVERLLASQQWGLYDGRESAELRTRLSQLCNRKFIHPCASGTIAVELALRGLGINPGDLVALAAYDFPGNFRAIEALQATPLLLDVKPQGWSLDISALEQLAPPYPKAIIVSHLHGDTFDLARLESLARERGIAILEDACQAPGASFHQRPAGSIGDVSVLSFGGSKLLSAGRGGAVLTDDPHIDQRLKITQDRGNLAYPLSELQAAVLIPQLDQLAQAHAARRAAYQELVALTAPLKTLRLGPDPHPAVDPAFYKIPITTLDDRSPSDLEHFLSQRGIPCGTGFRGFWRRSARRCQIGSELNQSRRASEQTLLLSHAVLRIHREGREILAAALLAYDQQSTRG